jgi:hypothetical protein
MKTAHTLKSSSDNAVDCVYSDSTNSNIVSEGSLIAKMLRTKKFVKAYLKGEISLSELESMGIELV